MRDIWLENQHKNVTTSEYELLKRASNVLVGNIATGEEFPWNPYRCILPGINSFPGIWNWDTAFHAIAVSRWDAELAKECILGFMQFQKDDGMLPDVIWEEGGMNDISSKPPVMPWATQIVYNRCGDKKFIEKLYPMFVKNEQWWRKERCSGALFHYDAVKCADDYDSQCKWESGWDNSVRWDFAEVPDLWAIDLNCYMVMFYRAMAFFAEELDLAKDAIMWNERAKELKELIEAKMWNENVGSYTDVNYITGEKSKILTPASFMPLFIGISPEKRAVAMNSIAEDKGMFAYGMPTVAYNDSGYSDDYWRGPTWLNVAYFAAKGLKDYGFESADKIKDTILKWCEDEKRGIFENYNSLTGLGLCCDHFSWSATFIIEFILNF